MYIMTAKDSFLVQLTEDAGCNDGETVVREGDGSTRRKTRKTYIYNSIYPQKPT
jgi:hypothetical protein